MTTLINESKGISSNIARNFFFEAHKNGFAEIRKEIEKKSSEIFEKTLNYSEFIEMLNFRELPLKYGIAKEDINLYGVDRTMKALASFYFGKLINDR